MLNRRSFLRSAPAAGAALAVPALAIAEAIPAMTPDERIDAALSEIVTALRERYPDCPIRVDDCDLVNQGMINIITHCGTDKPGTVNFRRRQLSA
nr:MAG TPA: protein NapD [Caudoviricetes sp.]